jgi:D-glycero-beta-D-manno-heptose 1-phosphate adenylyltransferase
MREADSASVLASADLAVLQTELTGRTVVLGTGCFDILHVGHLHFLAEASRQGEVLVIGVNSNRSVLAIKGPSRPIVGEKDRAAMVGALRCVDYVFIYDDSVADDCIRQLRPYVYVTGEESYGLYPTEVAAAEEVGARVHVVGRLAPHSTTAMLVKAQGDENRSEPIQI